MCWEQQLHKRNTKMLYECFVFYKVSRRRNPGTSRATENDSSQDKTQRNLHPWLSNVDITKLDDLLAGYDWYLFLRETDDQPLRFGTVTTQWKDMGAFRDFCFISELFPGDPTRPVSWIQNPVVADSMLKMLKTKVGFIFIEFHNHLRFHH